MTNTAFNLKQLLQQTIGAEERLAFFCKTNDEAKLLIRALYELGYSWNKKGISSKGYELTFWNAEYDKKGGCYTVNSLKEIYHGKRKFYEKRGREIIDFETLIEAGGDEDLVDSSNNAFNIQNFSDNNQSETLQTQSVQNNETNQQYQEETTGNFSQEDKSVQYKKYQCTNDATHPVKEGSKFCSLCGGRIEIVDLKPQESTVETMDDTEEILKNETLPLIKQQSEEKEVKTPTIVQPTEIENIIQNKKGEEQKETVEIFSDVVNSLSNKDDKDILKTEQNNTFDLAKALGVEIDEEFTVNIKDCSKIYRINRYGVREEKIVKDYWKSANDEQELVYLLCNPWAIQRM